MPPPSSIFVAGIIAAVGLLIVSHFWLVRQGRLVGKNIATHFIAIVAGSCAPFIEFFVPLNWHGGAKVLLITGCLVTMAFFGGLTRRLSPQPKQKRWKKAAKRT